MLWWGSLVVLYHIDLIELINECTLSPKFIFWILFATTRIDKTFWINLITHPLLNPAILLMASTVWPSSTDGIVWPSVQRQFFVFAEPSDGIIFGGVCSCSWPDRGQARICKGSGCDAASGPVWSIVLGRLCAMAPTRSKQPKSDDMPTLDRFHPIPSLLSVSEVLHQWVTSS